MNNRKTHSMDSRSGGSQVTATIKDEGDFFTISLYKGKPLNNGKAYPFGSIKRKHFLSEAKAKRFCRERGWHFEVF